MAARPWPRVKWTKAAQLAPFVDGLADRADLVEREPATAFAALRGEAPALAAGLVAQCLPRLDAVAWLAAVLATVEPGTPERRRARDMLGRWLREPGDELRRKAFAAGQEAGFDTPEGLACFALFLSGGSIAPATQEVPVPPPPGVFGRVAAGAVQLAAALGGEAAGTAARLDAHLATAEQVASGSMAR